MEGRKGREELGKKKNERKKGKGERKERVTKKENQREES